MPFFDTKILENRFLEGRKSPKIDEISQNVVSKRPGQMSTVVWATNSYPPDMDTDQDISAEVSTTTIPDGVVCRIARFDPGVAPRVHRTTSVDYAIVLSGELDMELDDEVVHIKAGDVLIQRGTVHNWINNGTEPCMMAFILIDSKMPIRNGERLKPNG